MTNVNVTVTLKPGLLDVQGKTIKSALRALGFRGVREVRMGKYIELTLNGGSAAAARKDVARMCRTLLSNPVIETYNITPARLRRGLAGAARAGRRRRAGR
ncbi:MAG TPA: phosphoribosylformylglycinamidine synthase subunit PurS [bacterium]